PISGGRDDVVVGSGLGGVERTSTGWAQKNEILQGVALAVIIKEEKQPVFFNRAPDIAAKLVEVVGLLGSVQGFSDRIKGIHRAIAVELKGRTMEIVCS